MTVQEILALIDAQMRLHELRAQTARTKTERLIESCYFNALYDLRFDIAQAEEAARAK